MSPSLPPLLFFSLSLSSFSLASQCDLASEGFLGNVSQLDDYCKEKGFAGWFETSAKENIGIDEAARCLVAKVSSREREREKRKKGEGGRLTRLLHCHNVQPF